MSRECQPGDVARIVLKNGHVHPIALWNLSGGWIVRDRVIHPRQVADARPLVVIDPESDEQMERLLDVLGRDFYYGTPGILAASLREFADPTPPEVFTHQVARMSETNIATALCGKVWKPGGNVKSMGRCAECESIAESMWQS